MISDRGNAARNVMFDCDGHVITGMTLRDYFAGQALAGILATYATDEVAWEKVAHRAFGLADAMLAARNAESRQ